MIEIKRIYDKSERKNGFRILIDRLWPRGLSIEKAKVDLWLKEIAPSDKLRKWFSHDSEKWNDFKKKYKHELKDKPELLQKIKQIENHLFLISYVYC